METRSVPVNVPTLALPKLKREHIKMANMVALERWLRSSNTTFTPHMKGLKMRS